MTDAWWGESQGGGRTRQQDERERAKERERKSDLHKGGSEQEMRAQANGGYLRNRNKRVCGKKRRQILKTSKDLREGAQK